MSRFARRLGSSVIVVWGVVSMAFAVESLLPGDPAAMVAGPQARPADVARIRRQLGLDQPPLVQYGLFWARLVHVGPRVLSPTSPEHATCIAVLPVGPSAVHIDLGKSFQLRQPVVRVIAARLPRTLALAVAAVFVEVLLGLCAGVIAAVRRGSLLDRLLVAVSVLGASAPTFLLALALQYLLAYKLRLLPLDGFGTTLGQHAQCIVLPALTLGLCGAGYYARLSRDEMSVLLRSDWVVTAQAKGLPRWRVVVVHALRNALAPLATAVALDFGALMGGAIVTESVFRWPGLGELSVRAMLDRDGPVVVGCVIITSVAVVVTNIAVELICARLDPRLRG